MLWAQVNSILSPKLTEKVCRQDYSFAARRLPAWSKRLQGWLSAKKLQRFAEIEKTGQKRFNEAEQLLSETLDRQAQFEGLHPLVAEMAAENVELSNQVVNLASEATETSKLTAVTRSRIDSIESDLLIARKLISLGNIDRRAGATFPNFANAKNAPKRHSAKFDSPRNAA